MIIKAELFYNTDSSYYSRQHFDRALKGQELAQSDCVVLSKKDKDEHEHDYEREDD